MSRAPCYGDPNCHRTEGISKLMTPRFLFRDIPGPRAPASTRQMAGHLAGSTPWLSNGSAGLVGSPSIFAKETASSSEQVSTESSETLPEDRLDSVSAGASLAQISAVMPQLAGKL